MEMDRTRPTPKADQNHPPSFGLEPQERTEKRKTSSDVENKPASRAKDRQHDLGGGKEDSPRSGKIEACSQGPMFQGETRRTKSSKSPQKGLKNHPRVKSSNYLLQSVHTRTRSHSI